jgi:hypothetical protein
MRGKTMSENKTAKTPADGGPAFPKLTQDERWKTFTSTGGMSLRDYFAAKAMQALAQGNYFDVTARQAYMIADAMLKAREQ